MNSAIGEIRPFLGNYAPSGWAICNGQLLRIAEAQALFALIGTTYGGDGVTTFALPNLDKTVPVDAGNGFNVGGAGIAPLAVTPLPPSLNYIIALVEPLDAPIPYVGEVRTFAFLYAPPPNWMPCEGQILPIGAYSFLYNLIGTTYGGDGEWTFALPDLRASSAQSAVAAQTAAPGPSSPPLGYLVMNFCVAINGLYPPGQS